MCEGVLDRIEVWKLRVTRCRYDGAMVQGCRRAEPVSAFRVMPHPDFLPSVLTMDDGDAAYDFFSSSHVWQQTAGNDDLGTYETSLFARPELDSKFCRVDCAPTRCMWLTTHSKFHKI